MGRNRKIFRRPEDSAGTNWRTEDFHMRYEVEDQVKERVEKPDILFYGKKILEMSIAALLQEITCYFPVRKLQEKMYYVRHWHGYSEDRNTTFLFM